MDNEELASFFAEKLKWEEQERQYKQKIAYLESENKKMALFISDLGYFPKFWARTYKKLISKFIEDNGLWKMNDDS